ncbi:hypothetical protein AMOR_15050 [Anaeromyxobacter oryzae]|uniref:Cardiolipin synthase N-terminal domain-containing protein n=2 Tax=Anaeromyxobacter oryzae TaxID=2918170 RepID=A0ABM7WSS5_9BACT|nr:hypothetical protein AMOR_15050 [Anaeromyxobacter oryzae]
MVLGFLVVSGLLSILCWRALWRGNDHIVIKVVWALLAAVPGLGALLFAVLHDPPPVQPEIDRAAGGDWDIVPNASARHHTGHDA